MPLQPSTPMGYTVRVQEQTAWDPSPRHPGKEQAMNGDLVGLLAGLYPAEPEARILLQRASLETPFTNFPGDALGAWGGILAEAEKRGKIARLVYRASEDF